MCMDVGRLALARKSDRWFGLQLTAPAGVILAVLLVIPTAMTIVYSFHDVPANARSLGDFVGFEHYSIILSSEIFWHSVWVTLVFATGFVVLSTVFGLGMALLLNESFVGQGVARALLIIPWATPWLVIGILWRWFVDGSVGGLNALLMHAHIIDDYRDFLADPGWALGMTILAAVWRQASFAGILILSGLQTLPKELGEAAAIDGAGPWHRFVHITLPWLRSILITVIVFNVIYAFLQFDVIFAMTQGGPGDATQVLSILIYRQLFGVTNIGLGSALSVLLSLVALAGGLIVVKLVQKREGM